MVEYKFYTKRAIQTFIKLAKSINDLTPVWQDLIEYYQKDIIPASWNSKGALMEGKRWKPLSEKYRKWKQKNYSGQPLMTLTGKLFEAATGGPGWKDKITPKTLEMGVEGEPYFYYVSERETYGRKYFYTSDYSLPNRAWAWLIKRTNDYIEDVDNDK